MSPPADSLAGRQRARIVVALVEEVAEKSFGAVTVTDVVRRARIARNTFYENFGSKEDCFLAAQEQAMSEAFARVVEASRTMGGWAARVRAGLGALLEYLMEEPELARTCVVEAPAAGAAAMANCQESQQIFASLLRLGRDVSPPDLPETLEEALVGGVFWIVYQRLATTGAEGIPELLPELAEFVLTPYLGPAAAAEAEL